jgi:hypothetical protein
LRHKYDSISRGETLTKGKLLVVILIIIGLVVNAYFGLSYIKEHNEHKALASQITDVSQTLAQIPQPPQDLEQRLAVAQASLAAEQSTFPSKMNSTEVINAILRLADACEVKAIPLITQPWSIENVGEHGYYVLRLDIIVKGSFSQLVSFLNKLENGEFKTLIVKSLSVTRASEKSEGETATEETIPVTASLSLAIYTQSPAAE